jgi:hypothetical protein
MLARLASLALALQRAAAADCVIDPNAGTCTCDGVDLSELDGKYSASDGNYTVWFSIGIPLSEAVSGDASATARVEQCAGASNDPAVIRFLTANSTSDCQSFGDQDSMTGEVIEELGSGKKLNVAWTHRPGTEPVRQFTAVLTKGTDQSPGHLIRSPNADVNGYVF